MTTDDEHVAVHTLQDGQLIHAYDCELTAISYACSIDRVEQFRTEGDPGWLEFPLPTGDVVYDPPSGWWVVLGDRVVPADSQAQQHADGPVTFDEFVAIATDGASPWTPSPLGMPWELATGLAALATIAVASIRFWRRSRREELRSSAA